MGDKQEPQLHRRVLARLGPAADRLTELVRDYHALADLRAEPAAIDPHALCQELDRVGALRALRLPLTFLPEVGGAPRQLHAVSRAVERLERLRALHLPAEAFDGVPDATVDCWRHRAVAGLPAESASARLPLLAALCWCRRAELTRDLLDVLLTVIGTLHARVLARSQPHQQLGAEPVGASGDLRTPPQGLRELVRQPDQRGTARTVRTTLHTTYPSDYQELAAQLLRVLEFRCASEQSWPLLAVLGELVGGTAQVWGADRWYQPELEVPLRGVVPDQWQDAVVDERGRVERVAYQLCVLIRLRTAVRRGDVTVPAAAGPPAASSEELGDRIIWPSEAEPAVSGELFTGSRA